MIDYPQIAESAHAAILDAGGPVTLIQPGGEPEYIPGVGMVEKPDVETECTGVVFDFGLHQSGSAFTAGSLIEAGDKQLYLSPEGVPANIGPGNRIVAYGQSYVVVSVKATAPAGVPVLYECQLRR